MNRSLHCFALALTLSLVAGCAANSTDPTGLTVTASDIYFPEDLVIDLRETGPVTFDYSAEPLPFDRVTLLGVGETDVHGVPLEEWMAARQRETGVDFAALPEGLFSINAEDVRDEGTNMPVEQAVAGLGPRAIIPCWDCTEESYCQTSPYDPNALLCSTVTICYGYMSTFCR